jgi:protein-disulfide isomerase
LGIALPAIDTCATSADNIALLRVDEVEAESNSATASPTLLVNGVTYTGARTPEGYKQAICNSFDTAPAECNTTLSSASAAAAGGCQ